MLEKNLIKVIEIAVLGFLFPLSVVYYSLSNYILFFLWIIFFYTIVIYFTLYYEKNTLKEVFKLRKHKKFILKIILRWFFLFIVLYLFTKFLFPNRLFLLQKENEDLLYKIFILYPIFSAFPQEFIFCSFFFKRYRSLFISEKNMIIMSSLIFCFAHIFTINWVAPLLGIFGGFLFAITYSKTKSLLLVSFEHALYGNTLFFLGLGWFFWGGSVGN
ncbi:MAG: hypothetical protein CMJ06_02750 [Pelagibacterales bacterium]|nr:hypothetical protein [Pelagibacterales bacterium]OUU62969.1 MAG: hypothetical protein CBC22_02730 [Alphaproteobacteria bacterium TMED62]